jgi:hypothetical protein
VSSGTVSAGGSSSEGGDVFGSDSFCDSGEVVVGSSSSSSLTSSTIFGGVDTALNAGSEDAER